MAEIFTQQFLQGFLPLFLFAIVIALLITIAFIYVFRLPGWGGTAWLVFFLVLLAGWAVSVWITPLWTYYWQLILIPIFFVALAFALIFAAISSKRVKKTGLEGEASVALVFGVFYWIMIALLAVAIVIGISIL